MKKAIVKVQELQGTTIIKIALPSGESIQARIDDGEDKIILTSADISKSLTLRTNRLSEVIIKSEETIKP